MDKYSEVTVGLNERRYFMIDRTVFHIDYYSFELKLIIYKIKNGFQPNESNNNYTFIYLVLRRIACEYCILFLTWKLYKVAVKLISVTVIRTLYFRCT